jgi:hypothetical protein
MQLPSLLRRLPCPAAAPPTGNAEPCLPEHPGQRGALSRARTALSLSSYRRHQAEAQAKEGNMPRRNQVIAISAEKKAGRGPLAAGRRFPGGRPP